MSFYIEDYLDNNDDNLEELDESQFYGEIEDKPETERTLFRLQNDYLTYKTKDKEKAIEVWKEMFLLIHNYAASLFKQRLKNKTFISPDEVEDKSTMAAINFMSQYIYRKNYKVGASFAGMLKFKVIEALYKSKNDERNVSLNLNIKDTDTELSDLINTDKFDSENLSSAQASKKVIDDIIEKDSVMSIIRKMLKDVDKSLDDSIEDIYEEQYLSLIFRFFLLLQLKKSKKTDTKRNFLNQFENPKIVEFLELSFMELYNRLKES